MDEGQFTRLFKYIEDFRSEVNEKLDQKANKTDMDRLINTMDDFIRRITDNETDQAARDAQFARLVEWAR